MTRSDDALVAAYREGSDDAFAAINDRYRKALERYARRVLGKDARSAEDIVQEGLWRASRALRRDERPINLKPWLYRLVRNCCLDELSRLRSDAAVTYEPADARGEDADPALVFERRQRLRDLVGDIAALPGAQRHALLRRELDGVGHAQIAAELELTIPATKSLVHRARVGLTRYAEARDGDCAPARLALLEAHDERRRPSASALRHLVHCGDCREFRRRLREGRRASHALLPLPAPLLGLVTVKAAAGSKTVAAGTGVALTAGAIGLGTQVFGPGEPAPLAAGSLALPSALALGDPIPSGAAIVTHGVRLDAGTSAHPELQLRCPAGLRVADLLATHGTSLTVTYAAGTIVGASRTATIVFERTRVARAQTAHVAMLCKRPAADGSLLASRPVHVSGLPRWVARGHAYLRVSAGGTVTGSVRLGQPVVVVRTRGGWARVVTDTGSHGWVRAAALITRRIP